MTSQLSGSGHSLRASKGSVRPELRQHVDEETDAVLTQAFGGILNQFGDFASWKFDAVELHAYRLSSSVGIGPDEALIESERRVVVDLLPQLGEPLIGVLPPSRLDHDQRVLVGLRIMGHEI